MNYKNLAGVYELVNVESYKDGQNIAEVAQQSMFTFTTDNKLSVVSATSRMVMAYTGDFKIENDIMKIQIKSCTFREMEGTEVTRRIVIFDGTKLALEAIGAKSGVRSILTWKKTHQLS